ncbi:MFS transporter [Gemmobacter lanyuensis]
MPSSLLRAALVLGLLSAVGPFAIDMYLPALPRIGADLGASVPAMQGTITSYFIAFGLAQLIYGPWADQAGRKTPIYVGLGIFLLGTLICTFAPTTEALIFGRFVQGLGGAAVMVVPRAVIRDLSTGHEATRMMAAIMLVISVSPFLAPLVGAGLMALAGWRAIFGALILATVISLLMTRFLLQETLAPTDRQPVSVRALLRGARNS